jgi:protein-L-isoaspartate(D-aspartate) O-methyltransferase
MKKLRYLFILVILLPLVSCAQTYQGERDKMVEYQIERRGIKDPAVIKAMKVVKRHMFVPEKYQNKAYSDRPLPIGHGQTISQPYIVALMTELLNLEEGDKVLEIGTGSGYQAAVLSHITSNVYTIEIVEELANKAKETLQNQGYNNVKVKTGDGYKGWKEYAPFDAIIVTASPSDVPDPLKNQLAEGGRMIIPVGGEIFQELVLLEKENGKLVRKEVSSVRFVPMVDEDGERY